MPTKSRWGKIWFKPCLDQVNGKGRARGGGVGGGACAVVAVLLESFCKRGDRSFG